MKDSLSAQRLRFVLVGVLFLIVAAGIGAFIYSYTLLSRYTAETSTLDAQANLSATNVANLKALKQYLSENATDIQRAHDIVAESHHYLYQDDIINDISTYAAQSGVTITSFNFISSESSRAATPTPTTSQTAPTGSTAISGIKTTTASIVIKSPVGYTNLLNFIRHIERSPMKMQIASVSLSRAESADPGLVTTQSFTIEVYIR